MSIFNDKGFLVTVLGALLIFGLVIAGKADAEWLVFWLGGAAGPVVSRFARHRDETKAKAKAKAKEIGGG